MKIKLYILFAVLTISCSSNFKTSDNFEIHFEDVNHFWKVYDQIKLIQDNETRVRIIKQEYFERASEGLKLLIKKDKLTPKSFDSFIKDTIFLIRLEK